MATAARLFFEQGYQATGINQVLEEAGVAKASLYTHFGSKEELGLAYLKEARVAWFAGITAMVDKKQSPAERLLAIYDFLEQSMLANQFRGCRFINMLAELGTEGAAMQEQIREHKEQLRRYVRKLAAAAGQTAATGDIAYLLFESAITECKIYRDLWPVKAAKKQVKQLLSQ